MSVLLFTQLMLEFPEMSEHQEILVPLRTLDQDKDLLPIQFIGDQTDFLRGGPGKSEFF